VTQVTEEAAVAKQIQCVCGYIMQADNDDDLWRLAEAHIRTDHPDLVGKVNREEFLAQAEII
jgi:predicted small metal-binding protein